MAKKRFPSAPELVHIFDAYLDESLFCCDDCPVPGFSFDEVVSRLPRELEELPLSPWACDQLDVRDGSSYATGFRVAARRHQVSAARDAIQENLASAKISRLWDTAAAAIAQVANGVLFDQHFIGISDGTNSAIISNMGDGRPEDLTPFMFQTYLNDLNVEQLGFGRDRESYSWALIVNTSSTDKVLEALRVSFCKAMT